MNEERTTTTEEDIPQLNENCACCLTIPVSHLQFETQVPLTGWQTTFDEMGIRVFTDPAGRPAISTLAARKLLASRKRSSELASEARGRLFAKMEAKRPSLVGRPPVEGASAIESLLVGATSPSVEFGGGRERPNFLQEELAASQRADDEKKRLAVERKKQRLVDQMKDSLQ